MFSNRSASIASPPRKLKTSCALDLSTSLQAIKWFDRSPTLVGSWRVLGLVGSWLPRASLSLAALVKRCCDRLSTSRVGGFSLMCDAHTQRRSTLTK